MFGFRKKKTIPFVSAVIAAAGSATRMEGIDKQQADLEEIPVVVRAIGAFQNAPRIREIVLVCREEVIPDYYAIVQDYDLSKVASVVGGGENRQESVFRGIRACSQEAAYYAIHDGARPLISPDHIDQCIDAAFAHGAAAVGVPVKDTIKLTDQGGFIASTPSRERMVAIQTPQIFEAALYRQAMERAEGQKRIYTDDCQLVEQLGRKVFVSPGSYDNIKITTPEDLVVAAALIQYREEGEYYR